MTHVHQFAPVINLSVARCSKCHRWVGGEEGRCPSTLYTSWCPWCALETERLTRLNAEEEMVRLRRANAALRGQLARAKGKKA